VPRTSTPFGERLELELTRVGLTQQQFATEIGVSQQTVSKWITGETTPRFRHLPHIEEVVGVPVGSLSPLLFAPHDAPPPLPRHPRTPTSVAALRRKMNGLTSAELAEVASFVDGIFKNRS